VGVILPFPSTDAPFPQRNILVDVEGNPRLSDFGHFPITKNIDSTDASDVNHGYTVRYCAPELLDTDAVVTVEGRKPTNKSDVYSLSMVIVEVRLALGKYDSSQP
jgi:serine/threonine protein kinase